MVIVLVAARWLMAMVFWSTGMAKRADPNVTFTAASNYGLPVFAARLVARWVGSVELALAVGLAAGVALPAVGGATAWLLLTYASAMVLALAKGRRFPCGCGAGQQDVSPLLVLRNASLAGLACLVAVVPPAALAAWPWLARPHDQAVLNIVPVPLAMIALGFATRCLRAAWPPRMAR